MVVTDEVETQNDREHLKIPTATGMFLLLSCVRRYFEANSNSYMFDQIDELERFVQ